MDKINTDFSPKISVVCPVYNSASFITATLDSVAGQRALPWEIIIVDDGSDDDTVAIVRHWADKHPHIRLEIVSASHRGPGAARNSGVKKARGDWISFLDSDDHWMPEKLSIVSREIISNPDCNFLCHNEIEKSADFRQRLLDYAKDYNPEAALPAQLYMVNFFSTSAVTCRADIFGKSGFFDESLGSGQDYEMWLRMAPYIKPCFMAEALGVYNNRSGNISSSSLWKRYGDILRILLRHRSKVGFLKFLYRILRINLSFLKRFFQRHL